MPVNVGDTVHYVSFGTPKGEYISQCRAAIVSEVGDILVDIDRYPGREITYNDEIVNLVVLNPTGLFFDQGCLRDEDRTPGTFHVKHVTPLEDNIIRGTE